MAQDGWDDVRVRGQLLARGRRKQRFQRELARRDPCLHAAVMKLIAESGRGLLSITNAIWVDLLRDPDPEVRRVAAREFVPSGSVQEGWGDLLLFRVELDESPLVVTSLLGILQADESVQV